MILPEAKLYIDGMVPPAAGGRTYARSVPGPAKWWARRRRPRRGRRGRHCRRPPGVRHDRWRRTPATGTNLMKRFRDLLKENQAEARGYRATRGGSALAPPSARRSTARSREPTCSSTFPEHRMGSRSWHAPPIWIRYRSACDARTRSASRRPLRRGTYRSMSIWRRWSRTFAGCHRDLETGAETPLAGAILGDWRNKPDFRTASSMSSPRAIPRWRVRCW